MRSGDRHSAVRESPFPRFERISESLADEPARRPHGSDLGPPPGREVETPRTESYAELWRRASAGRAITRR